MKKTPITLGFAKKGQYSLNTVKNIYKKIYQLAAKDLYLMISKNKKERRDTFYDIVKYTKCYADYKLKKSEIIEKYNKQVLAEVNASPDILVASLQIYQSGGIDPLQDPEVGRFDRYFPSNEMTLEDYTKYCESLVQSVEEEFKDINAYKNIIPVAIPDHINRVMVLRTQERVYEKTGFDTEDATAFSEKHQKEIEESKVLQEIGAKQNELFQGFINTLQNLMQSMVDQAQPQLGKKKGRKQPHHDHDH